MVIRRADRIAAVTPDSPTPPAAEAPVAPQAQPVVSKTGRPAPGPEMVAIYKVDDAGKWGAPIVTQIVDASKFTVAEGYHQDYLQKNPRGDTRHWMRE